MENNPPYEPLPVDPSDPESIQRKLEEINDPEGPLAREARNDANYLRFLREDAVASLDMLVHPEREDVVQRASDTHEQLAAYITHKFGHP
jgi:hypothetical protein